MTSTILCIPAHLKGHSFDLTLATEADVADIRQLVNAAYQELSDMGLNYTATYQDEEITRERMSKGRTYILRMQNEIVATVLFSEKNYYTFKRTAYVSQFAVMPELKRHGIGTYLMDFCEALAKEEHFDGIQLDTAKPARHLVNWYEKRGYQIVGETRWEGKTYESWIFEKTF